jgi:hypothetical protein
MAGHSRPKDGVASARLCPAIHVFACCNLVKTWMPGDKPGHDEVRNCPLLEGFCRRKTRVFLAKPGAARYQVRAFSARC